jgi:NADH:ubiquinone oxidoreductase subunit F (NADH-binding)
MPCNLLTGMMWVDHRKVNVGFVIALVQFCMKQTCHNCENIKKNTTFLYDFFYHETVGEAPTLFYI